MARKPVQRTYVRHRARDAWGTGLLVHAGPVESTYVFADGARRVFKAADVERFLERAPTPAADVRARLERGLASGGVATPKAMSFDFVAQIRANRADPGPYLAYADWLQTQKDPRGELIVVQARLAERPHDRKLQAAQRRLFELHGTYFIPRALAEILEDNPGCSVAWRFGFLSHVRLVRKGDRGSSPARVIPELFAHPSAELLESLAFGGVGDDYIELVGVIAKRKHALLEELVFDPGGARPRIGNIAPLFPALPSLRHLRLRGGSLRMASAARHDNLRTLTVQIDEALAMSPIIRSRFTALETLELDAPGLAIRAGDISAMLDGTRMPKLRRLVLRNTVRTAPTLDAIVSAKHLRHLEELVVTGDLVDYTSAVQHAKQLAHLRVCDIVGAGAAARRQQASREWATLGRDDDIIWGERDGEAVFLRLGTTHTGCSCAAAQPCAHVKGLQQLVTLAHAFDAREVPDDFMRRLRRV